MVVNRQHRVSVALRPLEAFVERVQHALRLPERDVTVCLVSDAAIARLNHAFRGKRGPTDVLSFPANGNLRWQSGKPAGKRNRKTAAAGRTQGSAGEEIGYLGDIAISPETARRNARHFGRTLPDELRVLILHGMLHLAGYDHETDHGEMDRLERRLRRRLGLS